MQQSQHSIFSLGLKVLRQFYVRVDAQCIYHSIQRTRLQRNSAFGHFVCDEYENHELLLRRDVIDIFRSKWRIRHNNTQQDVYEPLSVPETHFGGKFWLLKGDGYNIEEALRVELQ